LPLTREDARGSEKADGSVTHLFFPSREYHHDSSASLAELTSSWLDELFGAAQPAYPTVSLARADIEAARLVLERLRRERHPVITINFGVGGNARKRVGDNFERHLVAGLLSSGATIVLDKGAGADEEQRAEGVIEFAKRVSNDRVRLIELDEQNLSGLRGADRIEAELVVWSGRIGLLAGLIGESDLYIGYDSAGQHIAAALGVPCIDVFAGFSSRRMLDRWRPTGRAETRVVVAEQSMTEDEVLAETLRQARELLRQPAG
jgi:ADP-heptose:LPS heptosyltransferase